MRPKSDQVTHIIKDMTDQLSDRRQTDALTGFVGFIEHMNKPPKAQVNKPKTNEDPATLKVQENVTKQKGQTKSKGQTMFASMVACLP
jgi:hypothetical protein